MNREEIASLMKLSPNDCALEIGPLNRPVLQGPNVYYFDLEPTDELKRKAVKEGLNPDTVPEITYNNPLGDLTSINSKFDKVFSAHVIEHQPNLIKHLNQVDSLLTPAGEYWLIIPDKRYCFDYFLPESKVSEILRAYDENHVKPNKYQVLEHRALTTHNDPREHWLGNHGIELNNFEGRARSAIEEFENSKGIYIDVHCWQFTPKSIVTIVHALHQLSLINLTVQRVIETPKNDLEFCLILSK